MPIDISRQCAILPALDVEQHSFEESLPELVAGVPEALRAQGRADIAEALYAASISVTQTSSDNWNGGTYGYGVRLGVTPQAFARLGTGDDVGRLETDLRARLNSLSRLYPNESVDEVVIAPVLSGTAGTGTTVAHVQLPSFWGDRTFRLFLSHVSAFKQETDALSNALADYGVSGFVAHEDIEPTREWEGEIRAALLTCEALVCLLTGGFNESKWTDQEVGFVLGRGIPIVPVRFGVDPYGLMGRYQGMPGSPDANTLASGIAAVLAKHERTRGSMGNALVRSFCGSGSFTESIRRVMRLEMVHAWTDELAEAVRDAAKNNSQIRKAYGVPRQVERVLASIR